MSVSLLMASPLAHGLFQRAIGESGAYFVPPVATGSNEGLFLKGAEEQGVRLASDLGATSLETLRNIEPERFLKDNNAPAHPIIDGYVVPEEPYAAYAAGRQNDVPILIGSNSDEGRPMIAGVDVKRATFAEDLSNAFYGSNVVRDLAEDYLKSYPAKTDGEVRGLALVSSAICALAGIRGPGHGCRRRRGKPRYSPTTSHICHPIHRAVPSPTGEPDIGPSCPTCSTI